VCRLCCDGQRQGQAPSPPAPLPRGEGSQHPGGQELLASLSIGGLSFAPPVEPKPKRQKRPKQKNDPKYVAAARELRDRYLEQMNAGLLLPPAAQGKYDVSRQIGFTADPRNAETTEPSEVFRLLDAA